MHILCPICRQNLPSDTLTCANHHTFPRTSDGIPNLLSPELASRLEAIAHHRERVRVDLPTIADYDGLPYNMAHTGFEWRGRAQSADIVLRYIGKYQPKTILEIGGWNGWLTHLMTKSASVLAVDFFADAIDGLGAMRHYQTQWERIQMDITDLTILGDKFDMVVINNGIHLLPDPIGTIRQAINLVADGGMLIALELPIYRNPQKRIAQIERIEAEFNAQGGVGSLFLHPTKGYLDKSHRAEMVKLGMKLRPYPRYKAIIKALITPTAPMIVYGVWKSKPHP
ncbi:MAG: methyltransferase domain-containing protein [Anaerolineae bacterium]|nr:methyltransferase domain-containing protein [Anaerolineae bacterium]